MIDNGYLARAFSTDPTNEYFFGNKEDGILIFNSLLSDIVTCNELPDWERANYLNISYQNTVEFLTRDYNLVSRREAEKILKYLIVYLANITKASYQIDYDKWMHWNYIKPNEVSFDIGDATLQPVLHTGTPVRITCYPKDKIHNYRFDGIREIPITFFRDYSTKFSNNNLFDESYVEDILNKMKTEKISIVVVWVDKSTGTPFRHYVSRLLRRLGIYALFMNVDLLNALYYRCSEDESHLKFEPTVSTFTPYPYFIRRNFARYIRVPYQSFDNVIEFYRQAIYNPDVSDIFISLYRTDLNGKLINTLIEGSYQDKNINVYVEMNARGDEINNYEIVKKLRREGNPERLRVIHSYIGMKVHAKVGLVVMNDGYMFVHLGTGNFNEKTTKLYTDIHKVSDHEDDVSFAMETFHAIGTQFPYVPPIKDIIREEIRRQASLGSMGRIGLKCNHLLDPTLIDALKSAINTGCSVRAVIRTSPGFDSVGTGIEVRTIIGRYLEHERFFVFGQGEEIKAYGGSTDLFFRNLYKRIESIFEIDDKEFIWELYKEIWFD